MNFKSGIFRTQFIVIDKTNFPSNSHNLEQYHFDSIVFTFNQCDIAGTYQFKGELMYLSETFFNFGRVLLHSGLIDNVWEIS